MANTEYGTVEEGVSQAQENTKKNRKFANVPGSGVYEHPESGQRAIVQDDPLWGNTQAQAFTRLGFKFVREAREDEVVTLPELAADTRKQEESSLKGLSARLDALEGVASENKTLTAEVAELRKKLEEAEAEKAAAVKAAKEEAKTAAADKKQIEDAGKANTAGPVAQSAQGAKENAENTVKAREENKSNGGTK